MKILVAARHGGTNGIETYTRWLVSSLEDRGHAVVLAERASEPLRDDLMLSAPSHVLRRLLGPLESRRVSGTLRAVSSQCDVLHVTYPEYALAGVGHQVVAVWHPQLGPFERMWSAPERFERRRQELLYALSDVLALRRGRAVALTDAVGRALARRGIPSETIRPFVPDEMIKGSLARRRACVFVSYQLDGPRKNLPAAVAAVGLARATMPELELLLVGDFEDSAAAERLPDYCRVLGRLRPAETVAVIRDAGCLVLSSSWEEFGYVILEALAAGASVATYPLAAVEGLGPADGVFVASRSVEGLAARVLEALSAPAFPFPDRFRASHAVPRLERLYEAVSEEARSTGASAA